MADDETRMTGVELSRWLVLAALLAIGVALFFAYATSTRPVIHPVVSEDLQ
jgi:HAMP domain-containing protein